MRGKKSISQQVTNFSIMNCFHSIALLSSQSETLHFSPLQEKTRHITLFLCMQAPHLPTQVKKHNIENPKSQFFQKSQSSRLTIPLKHRGLQVSMCSYLIVYYFADISLYIAPVLCLMKSKHKTDYKQQQRSWWIWCLLILWLHCKNNKLYFIVIAWNAVNEKSHFSHICKNSALF